MNFDKNKYDQEYAKKHFDRISLNVKKGEREIISKHATAKGYKNITEYIKDLIYCDMHNNSKNINIEVINQSGDNNTVSIN